MTKIACLLGLAALLSTLFVADAHPGEIHDTAQVKRDIAVRDLLARNARRSLDLCEGSADHLALMKKSILRRSGQLEKLRKARGVASGGKQDSFIVAANRHDWTLT
jgi:hypothetical protein